MDKEELEGAGIEAQEVRGPFPNEHAARLRDPGDFDSDTFRRKKDGTIFGKIKVPSTVSVIWAKLKDSSDAEDQPHPQALRFPTKDWTVAAAKKWLRDNNIKVKSFEPASKSSSSALSFTAEGSMILVGQSDGKRLSKLEMIAYTGGPLLGPGGGYWPWPVFIDLEGLRIDSQEIPIRFQHHDDGGVGHTTSVKISDGALRAKGVISRVTDNAVDVLESSKNGFPWKASATVYVDIVEFVREDERVSGVNGRDVDGPAHIIREGELKEISIVDVPADKDTFVKVAASMNLGGGAVMKGKEEETKKGDADAPKNTPKETKGSGDAPAAPENQPGTADSPPTNPKATGADSAVNDYREAMAKEMERGKKINALFDAAKDVDSEKRDELRVKAIQEGWAPDKAELEILRASRPSAPAVHAPAGVALSGKIIEAAALMAGRFENVEKCFDEKVLEAADRRFGRSIGLQEILVEVARAHGFTGRTRNTRGVLEHAFNGRSVQAGFSTIDIGGILSNIANKFMLEGFRFVEMIWRDISAIRPVNDFKTITSYRMVARNQYEKVGPGGEIHHGKLSEESYTNQADTYALMLEVSRTDIINDDLGAISTVPRELGRGAGLKINDVFWTEFVDSAAAFWKAGNNNLKTSNALSHDALTAAEIVFMDFVDTEGKPIGHMPRFLLVPVNLGALAGRLFKSQTLAFTASGSDASPEANAHEGKYEPKVSRYLNNASYGASTTTWYLLGDPMDLPVIETCFLNGQESPTIETADADFNVLGVRMRGFHDFGVNLQDHRGGVKNTA